jgi:hypothetical protein
MENKLDSLKEQVEKNKEEFLHSVRTFNYALKVSEESPNTFTDDTLGRLIGGINTSYYEYVNSRLEFTDEYVKSILDNKSDNNTKKD